MLLCLQAVANMTPARITKACLQLAIIPILNASVSVCDYKQLWCLKHASTPWAASGIAGSSYHGVTVLFFSTSHNDCF